jgi:hypothetical protein
MNFKVKMNDLVLIAERLLKFCRVEELLPIQDYGSLATEGQTTEHAQNDFCVSS